ncbi:ABC transporter substrate-binding protein, partial [Rhizobium ruizarguesonis]
NTELKVVAGMNNSKKPFDDKRVRQALMMAIDLKTVIDGSWSGLGTPIGKHRLHHLGTARRIGHLRRFDREGKAVGVAGFGEQRLR